MGRKNHRGRTQGQRPRRYYRPKKDTPAEPRRTSRAQPAAPPPIDDVSWHTTTRDPWADPFGLVPDSVSEDRGFALQETRTSVSARTCGRCAEWTPNGDGANVHLMGALGRGNCLHPASGFSFPPADTPACPYFH